MIHARLRCGLILLAVLANGAIASADPVDDYIRGQMTAQHIPGAVVMVLRNGKVLKEQAYGLANIELGVHTSRDSVFPLASVTRVFTATAVYMLVQEGKIHLDDKVTRLLPGLPDSWKDITILHCLSHTTGLADVIPATPAAAPSNWISAATQDEAIQKLAAAPPVREPGERSIYDQTGFLLLKMIVEKETGAPLEQFVTKRILEPLGMKSARYGDTLDIVPNRVALYMNFIPDADPFHVKRQPNGDGLASPAGKLWNDVNFLYPKYQHGGVGLNMSAVDLARFDTALTEGKLLNQRTLHTM